MSKKRTKYTSAFKTKLALELLQNESTIVQIFSKHNIIKHSQLKRNKSDPIKQILILLWFKMFFCFF